MLKLSDETGVIFTNVSLVYYKIHQHLDTCLLVLASSKAGAKMILDVQSY